MNDPTAIDHLNAALEGRYRVERELGQGGMATVYLAHDLRHERKVALKVLKPELAAVVGAERFLAEIKTTANLQHPHILPLFDSGQVDGSVFYVMPYVEGESLRARLDRERQLPIDEAVRLATEVAGALAYAHGRGVIHRDIKPENILLHEGQALVADFGIALAANSLAASRMTETGLSLGTPHYMSPEQAMGEREIDGRTDVYALGCVVYEMLAGEPPFTGPSAQSIAAKVLTSEAKSLRTLRTTVPVHVDAAVLMALQKLAADRFGDAHDFAEALNGRAVVPRVGGARSRDRAPLATMAAFLGLIALAAWGWLRDTPSPGSRVDGTWVVSTLSSQLPSLATMVDRFAVSRDGRTVAFVSEEENGVLGLYVRAVDELVPRRLSEIDGVWLASPEFSPDGAWLLVNGWPGVQRIPTAGGPPMTVLEVTAEHLAANFSWGVDDRITMPSLSGGPAVVIDSDGSDPDSSVVVGADSVVWRLTDLPNDRVLLSLLVGDGENRVAVREADGRIRDLLEGRDARLAPTGHLLYSREDVSGWSLVSVPFDPETAEVTGEETVHARDIAVYFSTPGVVTESGDLFYVRGQPRADRRIVSIDLAGNEVELDFIPHGAWLTSITTSGSSGGVGPGLQVSPDGENLVLNRWDGARRTIWVASLSSGTLTQVTFDWDMFAPMWDADGRSIVFSYFDVMDQRSFIWRVEPDGRGDVEPIPSTHPLASPTFVSGTGTIYYTDQSGGIWSLARSDSGWVDRPLRSTRANEVMGVASPEDRWLAWATDASGRNEVRVAPMQDPARSVQVSMDGGQPIRWDNGGGRLYYTDGQAIHSVAFRADGPDLGSRRFEFPVPRDAKGWDVAPDGQRAYFIRGGAMVSELVVAQGALPKY
jgi:serine/threonine protein kinase